LWGVGIYGEWKLLIFETKLNEELGAFYEPVLEENADFARRPLHAGVHVNRKGF